MLSEGASKVNFGAPSLFYLDNGYIIAFINEAEGVIYWFVPWVFAPLKCPSYRAETPLASFLLSGWCEQGSQKSVSCLCEMNSAVHFVS